MREMGLEPTRLYKHKILSLACLPIPALPPGDFVTHIANNIISLYYYESQYLFQKKFFFSKKPFPLTSLYKRPISAIVKIYYGSQRSECNEYKYS